ncbi:MULTISPECIES: hypothetical protein [unclassified Sphingomonas]|uniref:hypothetical protein n=1 Tax=unclassified Sphingomonas TaxID=196159 RepID=UPI002269B9F8|nr:MULTISPECIES: hypothetical protein [unclassified Sphingomonas]
MIDDPSQRGPMARRARDVAAGFADVGLTHAEELLRRLSPEGREQARREREAKLRRQQRLMRRLIMAAIASLLAWAVLAAVVPAAVALAAAAALALSLITLVFVRAEPRAPGREVLAEAALPRLAEEALVWLAAQRRGLPLPALELVDAIGSRLDELAPVLGQLDPRSSAALSIRKLVAVELPALIEGWRVVPVSARRMPHADGRSPDDHLINGMQLIHAEMTRASEQLGHGALDAIAVQGRYLELKYSDTDRLM